MKRRVFLVQLHFRGHSDDDWETIDKPLYTRKAASHSAAIWAEMRRPDVDQARVVQFNQEPTT